MLYHVPVTFKVRAYIPVDADSKNEAMAELRDMPPEELPENYVIDDVVIRAKEFREALSEDIHELLQDDSIDDESDIFSDRYEEE